MGELADRLAALSVGASAPGGGVHAEMHDHELRLYFSTDFYAGADHADLESRLKVLCDRVWWQHQSAERAVRIELGAFFDDFAETDEDRSFRAQRSQIPAVGRSTDGRITITAQGMENWRVKLAEGSLQALSETEFAKQFVTAFGNLIRDNFQKVLWLKGRMAS